MKTLALLLTSTQLCATGIDGWIYCGPTGKYVRFHDIEYTFNNGEIPKEDINHIYINSFGTEVGVGINICSFFLAIEGSYTRLYSSHFTDKSIQQNGSPGGISVSSPIGFEGTFFEMSDPGSPTPRIKLGGDFYTYDVKGGYLFQPLCNIPWGLYPLFGYSSDSVHAKILNFPGILPAGVVVNLLNFKPTVTLRGPALGFGTTYNFPYGFSIQAEGSWQWRRTTIASTNQFRFSIPEIITQYSSQKSGYSLWAQGPKVDLYLEYAYCNWFIGAGGEWQYLKQFGKSEGETEELDLITSLQNDREQRQYSLSPQEAKHFTWTNWNWKAYIGYTF